MPTIDHGYPDLIGGDLEGHNYLLNSGAFLKDEILDFKTIVPEEGEEFDRYLHLV